MNAIQFEVEQNIMLPTEVQLVGDCLFWRAEVAEDGFEDPFREVGQVVNLTGCLAAFTLLGEASPEAVLAFARRYGVLGVMPSGRTEAQCGEIEGEPFAWCFQYAEPVSIYQTLARQARSILFVMAALRSGKPVDPDVFLACFPNGTGVKPNKGAVREAPRRRLYIELILAAQKWSEIASYKFRLGFGDMGSMFRGGNVPPQTLHPQYRLEFGNWNQGAAWDLSQMPGEIGAGFGEEYSDEAFGDAVRETAMQVYAAELEVAPDQMYSLPSYHQRPSPLFNVLAYQLTQALTVKAGTYFCSGCQKFTSPKEGRNKPRKDKESWTCSAACETAFKKECDKQRNQAKSEFKQKAAKKSMQEELHE